MEFLDEETVTIDQSGDLPDQAGVDGQGGGGLVLLQASAQSLCPKVLHFQTTG